MNDQISVQVPITISTRVCSKCQVEKPISDFCKIKKSKLGIQRYCKCCSNIKSKLYYLKNKEECVLKAKERYLKNKEKMNLQHKKWLLEHKESEKTKSAIYRLNLVHRKKARQYNKKYGVLNRQRRNEYRKDRRITDPVFRINERIRSRIRMALKSQCIKKSMNTIKYLGCTKKFFINYVQSLFKEGMTLENNGKRKWQLHHIKFCSTFDLKDKKAQKECFHYSNLTPLWEDEHKKLHAISNYDSIWSNVN